MTEYLIVMVYLGGAFADQDRKIGFWDRLMWPRALGERLAQLAFSEVRK